MSENNTVRSHTYSKHCLKGYIFHSIHIENDQVGFAYCQIGNART